MFWTRSDDAGNKALTLDPRPIGFEPPACPFGNRPLQWSKRRLLRRVRDHGRQHLRPPDALVYVALLRFTVPIGTQRRPGSCLLRRLLFPDERRVQYLADEAGNGLAELGRPGRCFQLRRTPGTKQPLRAGTTTSQQRAHSLWRDSISAQCRRSWTSDHSIPVSAIQREFVSRGSIMHWQNFRTTLATADLQRHFPWSATTQVTWADNSSTDLYPQAVLNPFLGQFTFVTTAAGGRTAGCDDHPDRTPQPCAALHKYRNRAG